MKRTLMTPAAIGAALVLGLAGCAEEDGVVEEEVSVTETEVETEVVEDEVTVEPTATVTDVEEVEVEVTETETETDVEFDPDATQELEDIEATLDE